MSSPAIPSSPQPMPIEIDLKRVGITDVFSLAERFEASHGTAAAVGLYRDWIAHNPGHELLHAAYFNYAVSLNKSGDRYGAMNALRASLGIRPDFHQAHINLGRLLEDDGRIADAIQQWLTLVGQTAAVNGDTVRHKLLALQQLGRVLEAHHRDESAEDALRQALDINADQPEIAQHWIALRQRQCKWPAIAAWDAVPLNKLLNHISPLSLAVASNDPLLQLSRAFRYNRETIGVPPRPYWKLGQHPAPRKPGARLKIGYVSSDLREHAVGFAMTDVIETHDKSVVEVTAYYCGIERPDSTQARIRAAVDNWIDLTGLSDAAAAQRIFEDEIDILVDLNGYTKDARTRLFAFRPAPVIVNWFGFPGTMGSPFHNYILADDVVIPPGDELFYSEQVLRLPCYQPNDRKRIVAGARPRRSDVGLPDDTVVYCCFNGSQKLTPEMFQIWMEILAAVPASVLWLLDSGEETNQRLRTAALAQGIAPDRLVFAAKLANPEHLARYTLADLFLDTFPYGAHTTASDAMWMGVPVLTYPGVTFASRVCASLVRAAGMDDLVCTDPADYKARAINLGQSRNDLNSCKQRLIQKRDICPLFDTPALVHHLEALFQHMWTEACEGRTPVPDLTNLDTYFTAGISGATATPAAPQPTSRTALIAFYKDQIANLRATMHVPVDTRLDTAAD